MHTKKIGPLNENNDSVYIRIFYRLVHAKDFKVPKDFFGDYSYM